MHATPTTIAELHAVNVYLHVDERGDLLRHDMSQTALMQSRGASTLLARPLRSNGCRWRPQSLIGNVGGQRERRPTEARFAH